MGLKPSLTLSLPFIAVRQARHRLSPVDFLHAHLNESIPSFRELSFPLFIPFTIIFVDLNGLIRPALIFCMYLRLARSHSGFKSRTYSSHCSRTVSCLSNSDHSKSARNRDVLSHQTSCVVVACGPCLNS